MSSRSNRSLSSTRFDPHSTGSRFFCAVTQGTEYSGPGMRVKCVLYTVGYIILGRNAHLYFDVKLKYLYVFSLQRWEEFFHGLGEQGLQDFGQRL